MNIEMGGDAKATQLTWYNGLSIPQKYLKDVLNLSKL